MSGGAQTICTIWCDLALPAPVQAQLAAGVAPHHLVAGEDRALGEADVAFGQPDAARCAEAARLRWVHLSTAGYTAFDRAPIREALAGRGALLTTSSSVFSEPCAQHLLAFMLADARQLPRSVRHQVRDRAWTQEETRAASYLLHGQTVVMVGFGAIARRLCELLAPFGLTIVGLRRRPRGDEPVPTYPLAAIDDHLARADHVLNILPASEETARFFDRARLGAIRRGAVFYNIGRGSTVDQAALVDALASGAQRAAYLDVATPEPLPPSDPLWSAPNCVISPHSAGGHATEGERLVQHFLANLRRHDAGQPLMDRVL
jgi:phosphoglycerate dehydrogenase-like enzyme